MTIKYTVIWDTTDNEHPDDEDPPDLPGVVEVPSSIGPDDVADWISDEYGFLVSELEEVEPGPDCEVQAKAGRPRDIRRRTDKALWLCGSPQSSQDSRGM